jgi:exosortase
VLGATVLVAGIVAYWPTLQSLGRIWSRDPDYSHGFLVIPLAVCILWLRRETFPGLRGASPKLTMGLLLISVAMRYLGGRFYYLSLEGWSLVPWAAAVVTLLGGRRLLRWAWPSLGFLIFLTPLPFSWEGQLAYPLQKITTIISATTLQLCGQTAFAEDTTILLGTERLQVAPACCGIRLFISTFALVYALMAISRGAWWEKLCLLAAAPPIALLANALRITFLGLSYSPTMTEEARRYIHGLAGTITMFVAACLLWLLLWYLKHLFQNEDVYDAAALIREAKLEP